MKSLLFILTIQLAMLSGCASKSIEENQKAYCASIEDEPVSVCRAEYSCGKGSSTNYIAIFFGGLGRQPAGYQRQNQAADTYQQCIDRNMSAQQYNFESKK